MIGVCALLNHRMPPFETIFDNNCKACLGYPLNLALSDKRLFSKKENARKMNPLHIKRCFSDSDCKSTLICKLKSVGINNCQLNSFYHDYASFYLMGESQDDLRVPNIPRDMCIGNYLSLGGVGFSQPPSATMLPSPPVKWSSGNIGPSVLCQQWKTLFHVERFLLVK